MATSTTSTVTFDGIAELLQPFSSIDKINESFSPGDVITEKRRDTQSPLTHLGDSRTTRHF